MTQKKTHQRKYGYYSYPACKDAGDKIFKESKGLINLQPYQWGRKWFLRSKWS